MKKNVAKVSVLAALSCAFAMSGCRLDSEVETIDNPLMGASGETSIALCTDGIDNDGNGLIDCEDPGCLTTKGTADMPGPARTVCPTMAVSDKCKNRVMVNGVEQCFAENTIETCSDGIDNDGNGFVDCEDNSCKRSSDPVIKTYCCPGFSDETSLEACSDGIDNDCNGFIDCADYSCSKSSNPEVKAYCDSKKCPYKSEENTPEACRDGIDNDCDDKIDCEDSDCSEFEFCKSDLDRTESEDTDKTCKDGMDNDLNGLTDCDDSNCKSLAYCADAVPEPGVRPNNFSKMSASERAVILAREKELCTDGIDNNKNGLIDCDESACLSRSVEVLTGDEAQYMFTCKRCENDATVCYNGVSLRVCKAGLWKVTYCSNGCSESGGKAKCK